MTDEQPSEMGTWVLRARLPAWMEWRDVAPPGAREAGDDLEGGFRAREDLNSFLLHSLQTQNLLVLAGSGTSVGVGGPSMPALWAACVEPAPQLANATFEQVKYGAEADQKNIEELLSHCDAFLEWNNNNSDEVSRFRARAIGVLLELCRRPGQQRKEKLATHQEFLRRLARRRARDTRLKVFTTNYDRCFDRAAGHLGLVAIDGFSFAHPRRFDPRYFEYDIVTRGVREQESLSFVPGVFQYYKLHGSVDWRLTKEGVEIDEVVTADHVALIYPAATKFRTSYQQPHLELMAQYLAALRQPNTCLLVVGFGFNDAHLTEPILAALDSNPHLRVVVVDPRAESALGREWERLAKLAGRGVDVAFIQATFEQFVPLVPDLRALSPAERLARAVAEVVD